MRTVVPGKAVDGRVVELRDDLPRALRAQPGLVDVVVHERDLLRRLVRRLEVVLRHEGQVRTCPPLCSVMR